MGRRVATDPDGPDTWRALMDEDFEDEPGPDTWRALMDEDFEDEPGPDE